MLGGAFSWRLSMEWVDGYSIDEIDAREMGIMRCDNCDS